MNFHQFINILLSHRTVVLSVLMMTVLTTLGISLWLPKQYIATTSIVVDQRSVDPVTGLTLPVQLLPGYIATQVDVISSHNVARKVVDKLKLSEDAKTQAEFAKAKSVGDIRDWVAESLLKKLEVKPSHESSVMQVDFTFTDPHLAANIANAFADAYIQTSIELQAQPAKLSADWFDSQMGSLRENLEHAQSVLSTYQQQHGIVSTEDRIDLENSRLSELSRQLVENQARTSELQSRKDLLASTLKQGGSSESLQEVLTSPVIQSLKAELAKAEAKFAELSKRIDVNHPQYKQAKAEVGSLKQRVQSEVRMVLDSIAGGVASSNQRDKIIANALAEQKAKVLELKKQHDEIRVLNREVENAQRIYDAALQRAVQSRMESEMRQTNTAVLNPAVPPQKPAKPKVLINVILSVFLGSILGMGSALAAELMDRRVRSAFDVSELAVPVFAVISLPAAKPSRVARLSHLDSPGDGSNNRGNA
ncbi:chain length determinant protein EpsF [Candidatus Methylobacter oryzae]|uniref:Chain length determinant protein EpsF n=1 Tax=Candidatus Methylobacter oryzae TaxID=2497749 RepID=A0ABY3C7D7_9GAMM|nr:chain length determinant protein EpsF [Candidatus Methylobacter oryzae]TRW91510.1 chain length determinant protein EpsF [Candidatus Methylobacter oryzae]